MSITSRSALEPIIEPKVVSNELKDGRQKKDSSVRTDDLLPQHSELIVNDACSAAPIELGEYRCMQSSRDSGVCTCAEG